MRRAPLKDRSLRSLCTGIVWIRRMTDVLGLWSCLRFDERIEETRNASSSKSNEGGVEPRFASVSSSASSPQSGDSGAPQKEAHRCPAARSEARSSRARRQAGPAALRRVATGKQTGAIRGALEDLSGGQQRAGIDRRLADRFSHTLSHCASELDRKSREGRDRHRPPLGSARREEFPPTVPPPAPAKRRPRLPPPCGTAHARRPAANRLVAWSPSRALDGTVQCNSPSRPSSASLLD